MKWHRCVSVAALAVLVVNAGLAHGAIQIDFVTVGNAGNKPDTRYDAMGYGAVDHVYAIGKYEVTAGQYTAFLNAVAGTDTYGLYNTSMWLGPCKIQRDGESGSYRYSVAADRANRPVNFVSWGDAARFTDWLHNGQGSGSTETGAYALAGATDNSTLMGVARNVGAKFWIPTENEWYKAAYHKNDGATGNYWDYPTGSYEVPSNQLTSPDPGNNANFWVNDSFTDIDYGMTEVGAFTNSESPYGTFDQGGNVWEWVETAVDSENRGVWGGAWDYDSSGLLASFRNRVPPTYESIGVGFRVASNVVVPEPASVAVWFGLCGTAMLLRRRRK